MTRRRRTLLRTWAPLVLYVGLIFTLSHIPVARIPVVRSLTLSDKILHALEYALLCVLAFRLFRTSRRRWLFRWAAVAALVFASLFGLSDEWHQGLVGRDADVADWLADTVGAALAAAVLMVYTELHPERPADDDAR